MFKNLILSSVLLFAIDSFAQEWPQWRGPNRDGVVGTFTPPAAWPDQLKQQWKVTVGLGHSSPVVSGDRVYQFSRQEEQEVASCLDLASGRLLWEKSYPAPYRMSSAATSHGKGPKATPVLAGGKLFTFGISGILSALDATTGELHWRKEFSDRFSETSPLYGAAMSALVEDSAVIVHVGGQGGGALEAFATDSGQIQWSWNGDGPGYASPIIVELGGVRQLVTQSQENIIGIDINNGKLLWKIAFTTAYVQNIVTAVVHGGNLIFSGLDKGVFAIRVTHSDGQWHTEKVWENRDISMYMSSPVMMGDLLFGLSHKKKGQFFCLDARTGATQWTSNGRQGDSAAVLRAGEVLFLLTTEADLIIAEAHRTGFEVLRNYSVAQSPTWAHHVVLGNRVLIKDESTLALWTLE